MNGNAVNAGADLPQNPSSPLPTNAVASRRIPQDEETYLTVEDRRLCPILTRIFWRVRWIRGAESVDEETDDDDPEDEEWLPLQVV